MSANVDLVGTSQLEPIEALHAFQDQLLPETIANALRASFFREHWAGCDLRGINHDNLAKLPTMGKEHVRAAGEGAQVRTDVICNDVFTTGTTGDPLITVRSDREQKFIRDFFRWQLRERPAARLLRGLEFKIPITVISSEYQPSSTTTASAFMTLRALSTQGTLFSVVTATRMWKSVARFCWVLNDVCARSLWTRLANFRMVHGSETACSCFLLAVSYPRLAP